MTTPVALMASHHDTAEYAWVHIVVAILILVRYPSLSWENADMT